VTPAYSGVAFPYASPGAAETWYLQTDERSVLKAIGYWTDIEPADGTWQVDPVAILAALGPHPADPVLVSYLRNGHEFEKWRGWSWCRFRCGAGSEDMGHSDLTDGLWVWPEGLVHYVEVHALPLPEEFVARAHQHGGVIPPFDIDSLTLKPGGVVDPVFWNTWFEERVLRGA
jgi:hypothetical protein